MFQIFAVKNRGGKEELNDAPAMHKSINSERERDRSIEKLEINPRREESNGSRHHQFSDSESLLNSPTSQISSNECGNNFTGSSSSSSSSSSGGCCSGSITEEDDDGCLDDWEAIADALAATDDKEEEQNPNPNSDYLNEHENVSQLVSSPELTKDKLKPKGSVNSKAWRPDDAFRPQSLPNLVKHRSFPMNSERHYGSGGTSWACNDVKSTPSSCPICFEDLDLTDSSFLPCPCGFRLCLFCHKRILEQDARCPGCRKQYEYRDAVEGEATLDGGNMTFRLARSCSMITRS